MMAKPKRMPYAYAMASSIGVAGAISIIITASTTMHVSATVTGAARCHDRMSRPNGPSMCSSFGTRKSAAKASASSSSSRRSARRNGERVAAACGASRPTVCIMAGGRRSRENELPNLEIIVGARLTL